MILLLRKFKYMEWVSIKPCYQDGKMQHSSEQAVFSLFTKAGFQLEHMRRAVFPPAIEYFYFHPALHIQVHEVQGPNTEASQFFIFYPGGSTVFAEGVEQLQQRLAAGYNR
jgi:hypothetical protein